MSTLVIYTPIDSVQNQTALYKILTANTTELKWRKVGYSPKPVLTPPPRDNAGIA